MSIKRLESTIDIHKCTGCGLCVKVCPTACLAFKENSSQGQHKIVQVISPECLGCCHCKAVCPVGAIENSFSDEESQLYKTFDFDKKWVRGREGDLEKLVQLMASRRSCRSYTGKPVDRKILEDLVKIGITAPSGTNSQKWTFTCVPDRERMLSLAGKILNFFRRLNSLAEWKIVRHGLRLFGQTALNDYYNSYYKSIKKGIELWDAHGTDRLWHGATAAVIIASQEGASCPAEDCLLAASNIGLGAHAMGLGSCLIGFAVSAMEKDKSIQKSIGIPANERVYAVVALGHTEERYHTAAGRKMPEIRWP